MEKLAQKPARSNLLLPPSVDSFRDSQLLYNWHEQLWSGQCIDAPDESSLMLLAYMSMLFDTGIPHLAALDTILALRSAKGRSFDGVTIPAQRLDYEYGNTRLHLSKRTRLAIYGWKSRWPDPAYQSIRKNTKERTQAIESKLKRTFEKRRRNTAIASISFHSVGRLSRLVAMKRGLDPFLISIYASSTRVTDQAADDVYLLIDSAFAARDHLIVRYHSERTQIEATVETELVCSEAQRFTSHHWSHRAKELLRRMCGEIRSAVPKRQTDSQESTVRATFARFRSEALTFSGSDSALVVAIDYSEYIFSTKRSVSSGSLRNYLDRCVINGLLNNPESDSLDSWDPDDYFDNYEHRISAIRLKRRSRANIAQAYLSFFRFLAKERGVAGLPSRSFGPAQGNAAGQWRLLPPPAIDELIDILFETGDFVDEQVGLSMWAGLLRRLAGFRAQEFDVRICSIFQWSL